jgi:hypothetical protein
MPISGTRMPERDVLTLLAARSALPGCRGPRRCGSGAQTVLYFGTSIELQNSLRPEEETKLPRTPTFRVAQ